MATVSLRQFMALVQWLAVGVRHSGGAGCPRESGSTETAGKALAMKRFEGVMLLARIYL